MARSCGFALALGPLGCGRDKAGEADTGEVATGWSLPLPEGFPVPVVPAENPATPEKFEFGRSLFYDRHRSGNGEQSCSDCHDPALSFTDALATPTGSTGDAIPRDSMALVNVAWLTSYTWPNPMLPTLEDQLLIPMFNDGPIELGMSGHQDEIVARLGADPQLVDLGDAAFPDGDAFDNSSLVYALATFVRGLISAESSFNTKLYNVDGAGAHPEGNQGLYEPTGAPEDMGRTRVPTLRDVALTAPYLHDGSIETLPGVAHRPDLPFKPGLSGAMGPLRPPRPG